MTENPTQTAASTAVATEGLPEAKNFNPKTARRAVVSGTMGTALEWFDFAVYGALSATLFPALFFNNVDADTALLASFATFGAGIIARPIGGVFFGYLGDKLGRRNVLMATFVLMGAASVLIGLLPTAQTIGIAAPILLVVLRFLQGFSLGGEATGVQVLVVEHAPRDRRGMYGGVLATGSPLAQTFASLTLTGLAFFLTEEQFQAWGWRVPFLLGVFLLVVGIFIRRRIEETPAFQESKRKAEESAVPQERALAVLKHHPGTVLKLIGSWAASAALFWICVTYAVTYMTRELSYSNDISFGLLLIANLVSIPAAVIGGHLSDRMSRRHAFLVGLIMMAVAAFSLFPVLNTENYPLSVAVITLALCGIQITAGAQPALFAEALPTRMRYTGSALGMSGAALIFGAPIPFVAAWIFQNTSNGTLTLTLLAGGIVVLSIISVLLLPERTRGALTDLKLGED